MQSVDIAIIGGGIMGVMTALELQKVGKTCVLIDEKKILSADSASGSMTRAGHSLYDDVFYAEMADISLDLYLNDFEDVFNNIAAFLAIPHKQDKESYAEIVFKSRENRFSFLEKEEIAKQYPSLLIDAMCKDKKGGVLLCAKINAILLERLKQSNILLVEEAKVSFIKEEDKKYHLSFENQDNDIIANKIIIAVGCNTNTVLKLFDQETTELPITPTYPLMLHYKTEEAEFSAPPFAIIEEGFFHLPPVPGYCEQGKIGMFTNAFTDMERVGDLKAIANRYMPQFDEKVSYVEVPHDKCAYDETPDGHFIIGALDNLPNVILACGFNGTGYKFAPLIGQMIAEQICEDKLLPNLWSPNRF